MKKRKAVEYKVWIHIEGLDKNGDCIEGDDYFEPREAACFTTADRAEGFRNILLDHAFAYSRIVNSKRWQTT